MILVAALMARQHAPVSTNAVNNVKSFAMQVKASPTSGLSSCAIRCLLLFLRFPDSSFERGVTDFRLLHPYIMK